MKKTIIMFAAATMFLANSAQAQSLTAGQSLYQGQSIFSSNGTYKLTLQAGDGNLVLFRVADYVAIWSAYTYGGTSAKMQEDRNFVVYRNGGVAPPYDIWSSNTHKSVWDTGTRLEVRNDGSLYLYKKENNFEYVIWATPADPAMANFSFGDVFFAACQRPGTKWQSSFALKAGSYSAAQQLAALYNNDGVALFECK